MNTDNARVFRSADRTETATEWLLTRHSFSFGDNYDPANTHHGALLANNDETVIAGQGFDMHHHRDMEIVTWVLDGELTHRDTSGNSGVVYPGLVQAMSAGSGVKHSERNNTAEVTRFIQMWVVTDQAGRAPSYDQSEVDLTGGGLVPIASGARADGAVRIGNAGATLWAAQLTPGRTVQVPDAPYVHLFVTAGTATVEGIGSVADGDAVRFTRTGGHTVTAPEGATAGATELLIWEFATGLHASV